MIKNLELFLEYIDKELFFEAHEILEDRWKAVRETQRGKILRGLINGATSLQLYRLGRKDASERVWKTYLKYSKLIDIECKYHSNYIEIEKLLIIKKEKLISITK